MYDHVLVLFDLDNVLVHKSSSALRGADPNLFPHHRLAERTVVYLRPGLQAFFDKLSEHPHVVLGVWSSMQPHNVQLIVQLLETELRGVRFRVVLDRYACTPAPTRDNPYATRKLFSSFKNGCDTSNILLVDNDADKMLGNPELQCVVAPEFDMRQILHGDRFQQLAHNVQTTQMESFAHELLQRVHHLQQSLNE